MSCHPSVLVFRVVRRYVLRTIARLNLVGNLVPTTSEYSQTRINKGECVWQECMVVCSSLEVPACHLVWNVTVKYARWWHEVVEATCTVVHISGLPTLSKRNGATSGSKQTAEPPLFREHPPSRGGRCGRKQSRGNKTVATSPTGSPNLESYFTNIGLDLKELTAAVPPSPKKKKKKAKPKKEWLIRILRLEDFLQTWWQHTLWGRCRSFLPRAWNSNLGMVKIEAEHPVPGLDRLLASLEERCSTSFDITASFK